MNKTENYTTRYVNELTSQLKLMYPNLSDDKLRNFVSKKCKERFNNPRVSLIDENQRKTEMSLIKFIDMVETEKPILSGYGTLYKQHEDLVAILYFLVTDLGVLRKDAKNKMMMHLNDKDQTLKNMYNLIQLTYKLLGNSFYGATIEKSSFFYNSNFGPSITYTGVMIITTSLNVFEKFMSNNFYFRHLGDLTNYVNNIKREIYNPFDYIDNHIDRQIVIDYLYGKLDKLTSNGERDYERIVSLVNNLSDIDVAKVYFKNNLYKTIDNSERLQNLFRSILGNTDFLDPNEPPEKYISKLNEIWNILNEVVHYDYLDFYRYQNAEYEKRETILTVDTDSNFLYLYPFFSYCRDKFGLEDTEIVRMTTTNIMMYVLTALVTKCYDTLTKSFNIKDPEKREIIKMKNEFYYSRIMLTNSKKNYSGIINLQEGKILDPPKHDIKGLAIKKVSTNKEVREFFTELLKEDLLKSKEINVANILRKYNSFEDTIRDSFNNGELTFAVPGKVNAIDTYKEPYTQQTVRGSIIWNALYPDNEIVYPDKINYVKLKPLDYQDVMNKIYDNDKLSYEDKDLFSKIISDTIYGDEKLAKYGFRVICMPKSQKKIPSWLIPFIDIDKIIEDNMKPGLKLLESLEFKMLSYQVGDSKGELASNIISI